jgi:SWI/SNF-related matrix-associated actin-dependent regulator 1 of chromatin subfamily A
VRAIRARRKLFLTGTPICNRPRELWPIISFLDPVTWAHKGQYQQRYCAVADTGFGRDDSGAANLDELQERLRGSLMVRRLKSEVLTELPAKRRQTIWIPAVADAIAREQEVLSRHGAELEALKARIAAAEADEDEAAYREAVKEMRQAEFAGGIAEIARARHETALAKVPAVISDTRELLEAVDKYVLFAHHIDVLEALHAAFADCAVLLHGGHSGSERQAAVDRFMDDPECRLIIGGLIPMGTGWTLTRASTVGFAEFPWSPGELRQAEDRVHRISQRDSVLVRYLVMEDSIDANMLNTLVDKVEVIEQALDTAPAPEPQVELFGGAG